MVRLENHVDEHAALVVALAELRARKEHLHQLTRMGEWQHSEPRPEVPGRLFIGVAWALGIEAVLVAAWFWPRMIGAALLTILGLLAIGFSIYRWERAK